MSKTENKEKFAVIETGGKQYKVVSGEVLKIEKLSGDLKAGDTVTFDKVLLVSDGNDVKIGTPYIEGATIEAQFEETGKSKKIRVLRFRPKSRYTRRYGHRQPYSKVTIKNA